MSDLYILFGSQTGNAEEIAKDIHGRCLELGLRNSHLMNLNAAKKLVLRDVAKCIVVVCSTTGNGDAPENADAFWRTVKLRSAAKDLLSGIHFAVLGLGDTNYDKFCYMGKQLDKRFAELGALRMMDVCCADEGIGNMEEVVNEFRGKVLAALPALLASSVEMKPDDRIIKDVEEITSGVETMAPASAEGKTQSGTNESKGGDEVSSPTTSNLDAQLALLEAENFGIPRCLPEGIQGLVAIAESLSLADVINNGGPADANVAKPKACVETVKILDHSGAFGSAVRVADRPAEGWTVQRPYEATVRSAHWLTKGGPISEGRSGALPTIEWGSSRRVVEVEFSLGDSGIQYLPGDSVGICIPNPNYMVEVVMDRLANAEAAGTAGSNEGGLTRDSVVLVGCIELKDGQDGQRMRLEELVRNRIDLVSAPRRAAVATLAACCTDPQEGRLLRWLCSKCEVGKALWPAFVEKQCLGIGELLALFPSCKPSLSALMGCAGDSLPRYYSIASSSLAIGNAATIAFSIVHFTCGSGSNIRRAGLCTSYMEKQLARWLYPVLAPTGGLPSSNCSPSTPITLKLFHRSVFNFRLPASVGPPLILIGPGTGVAPFVGFLQHRTSLERERKCNNDEACSGTWRGGFELDGTELPAERNHVGEFIHSVLPGAVHLYFGCRDDSDWLYQDFMTQSLKIGTLTSLQVATSRTQPTKVYVTHKLAERAAEVARMILREGAYVYVCGDGNAMAKDVYSTIKRCLAVEGELGEVRAEEVLQDLKMRKRYVLEIWS